MKSHVLAVVVLLLAACEYCREESGVGELSVGALILIIIAVGFVLYILIGALRRSESKTEVVLERRSPPDDDDDYIDAEYEED